MIHFETTINTPQLIATVILGAIGINLAWKNYRRKSGLDLRAAFTTASSVECNDRFVSSVTVENLKDRTLTIYAIYIQLSVNYYVLLKDFKNMPYSLKPYESLHLEFGPIQFYSINTNAIDLNPLFADDKVKKRIVLSTSDGKYIIRSPIRKWDPIQDFFKNYGTAIIRPRVLKYKDHFIGGNIRYFVDFTNQKGNSEVITLLNDDYSKFKKFRLTKESLESVATLENYLNERKKGWRFRKS